MEFSLKEFDLEYITKRISEFSEIVKLFMK